MITYDSRLLRWQDLHIFVLCWSEVRAFCVWLCTLAAKAQKQTTQKDNKEIRRRAIKQDTEISCVDVAAKATVPCLPLLLLCCRISLLLCFSLLSSLCVCATRRLRSHSQTSRTRKTPDIVHTHIPKSSPARLSRSGASIDRATSTNSKLTLPVGAFVFYNIKLELMLDTDRPHERHELDR